MIKIYKNLTFSDNVMDECIIYLLEQTVPTNLRKSIWKIYNNNKNTEIIAEIIAEVIIQFWSREMFSHVENLILDKAITENYFTECQLPLIKIFSEKEKETQNDWVIQSCDNDIINLVWNIFNMKQHFDQVKTHRHFINQSYHRLKEFCPVHIDENLIIARHDLSKYSLRQAIGYTLKWVWKREGPIWWAARDLHLQNEPHHPQMWWSSNKKQKILHWLRGGFFDSAIENSLKNHNFNSTDFPSVFLYESLIDMIAAEWERKKGGRLDITTCDLLNLDKSYFNRYNLTQRNELLEKINEWQQLGLYI